MATPRIVYALPGMGKIRARKDLTYKRVAETELKMDVYQPAVIFRVALVARRRLYPRRRASTEPADQT